ncbi:MAG: rhodanese-like domain-containing protein, partial [Bacteroidota bacterium]|nr:rhodanese-like domain-containing protein [Bacteroidota bacterium]
MKKLSFYLIAFLMVPAFLFTGCKEEEEDSSFDVLKTHLVANNLDIDAMLDGWITPASAVVDTSDFSIPGYYVVDIREVADYTTGHIKGAVPSTLGTILASAAVATDPILVVCYTGQSAAHAVIALRLSGYADAKVLKWGMAGWNADFSGKWTANSGADNGAIGEGHANWTYPMDVTASAEFGYPTIDVVSTDGETMLVERVAAMLVGGFQNVPSADVLATPGDYFINNFWDETDVEHYGHITGAYRIKPLTIAGDEIANLDPSATVVTYCWTGQTSSMVTAYLTVLGYTAKSLK